MGGVADGELADLRRADARLLFAVNNIIGVGIRTLQHGCSCTCQPLVGIGIRPGCRDGVEDQERVAEVVPLGRMGEVVGLRVVECRLEDVLVDTAEEQQVVGTAGKRRGTHEGHALRQHDRMGRLGLQIPGNTSLPLQQVLASASKPPTTKSSMPLLPFCRATQGCSPPCQPSPVVTCANVSHCFFAMS